MPIQLLSLLPSSLRFLWLPQLLLSCVKPAVGVLLVCTGLSVLAQPEEVVVIGVAPEKLQLHVEGLLDVSPDQQIARWRKPLCLQTMGLPDNFASLQRSRLSDAAKLVRKTVLDDGCQPNVLLFFSNEAKKTTKQVFDHFDVSLRQVGQERIKRFRESNEPVRWIPTLDRCGFGCSLANSRISASSAPSIDRMLLVIDVQQIQNRSFTAIADYIAFVVLANPAPNSVPALGSIMRLFATQPNADKVDTFSIYDELYLEALYTVPMDRYAKQQQSAIAARMMTRLAEAN